MNWRRRDRRVLRSPPTPPPDPEALPAHDDGAPPPSRSRRADDGDPTQPAAVSLDAPPSPDLDDAAPPADVAGAIDAEMPLPPAVGSLRGAAPSPAGRRGGDRAVVMCVTNQKGGVGKTTTTLSVGAALAEHGHDVLVVDLDPQGNATTGLGLRVAQGGPSTYRVLVGGMAVAEACHTTAVERLHLVPSSLDLAGAEIELVPQFSREGRLQQALGPVRDDYDVILVDCPPSLGLLTINALVAADQVLVPIQCEYYALEGLGQLMHTIELVRSSLNRDLELGGVVMTMFDARTNLSQQVVDEVRKHFADVVFATIVPRTVRLSEAPSYGQPITVFDPSSRGARAYQQLAREVSRRLGLAPDARLSPLDEVLGSYGSQDGHDETRSGEASVPAGGQEQAWRA